MATSEISEQAAVPGSDHRDSSITKQITWRSCRSLNPSKIHGFDNELMLLRNLFQGKEEFKAIGIVGVQGVGKSALCRKLLETSDVKEDYLPRIWISMSTESTGEQDRKAALVKRILLCLGFEESKLKSISSNQNLNDLLYVLHLQLTGKRYLIVLDDVRKSDVRESEDWLTDLNDHPPNRSESHLVDGLPKKGGGRVIVTSRSSGVAKAMVGEKNTHQLLPFTDPESFWEIYKQEVKNGGSESCGDNFSFLVTKQDLVEMKQELLEKCRGLPLVAKMLGEIKFRDEAEAQKKKKKKPHGR